MNPPSLFYKNKGKISKINHTRIPAPYKQKIRNCHGHLYTKTVKAANPFQKINYKKTFKLLLLRVYSTLFLHFVGSVIFGQIQFFVIPSFIKILLPKRISRSLPIDNTIPVNV